MIVMIILTLLTFAGAVCGIWGIGESEGICNYNNNNNTEDQKQ